ncbi:MAG: hypothetical protein WBA93_32500 [Microcoleaceae cyanobacterium]
MNYPSSFERIFASNRLRNFEVEIDILADTIVSRLTYKGKQVCKLEGKSLPDIIYNLSNYMDYHLESLDRFGEQNLFEDCEAVLPDIPTNKSEQVQLPKFHSN